MPKWLTTRTRKASEGVRIGCSDSIGRCALSERGYERRRIWYYLRTSSSCYLYLLFTSAISFDVAIWIKKSMDAEKAKAAAQSGGLKIAGSSGDTKQEDTIGVVMSVDKDEATQRAEREREANAKRMQNVLPAWHLKSTISGDLTALGIRENARTEQQAEVDANRLPSSNDAILRGLGKVEQPPMRVINEDTKPLINQVNDTNCACLSTNCLACIDIVCRLRSLLCNSSCVRRPLCPRHSCSYECQRFWRGRRGCQTIGGVSGFSERISQTFTVDGRHWPRPGSQQDS